MTVAVMLAIAVEAAATGARAAPCGKPDLVDMVPPDGATGVPLNARLGAHYTAAAEYLGEDVVLVHPDLGEETLAATWDPTEQLLSVTPTAPLAPGADYSIRWPALRGLNAAAPGLGATAKFTAGTTDDATPPTFAGVAGVTWDLERVTDDCTDDLIERFVFDVDLGPVNDDGGTEGLTLMLFQTKGPQATGTPTPIPARAWPQGGPRTQVKLAKDASVGEICFVGIARDTVGQLSQSNSVEACVQTTAPPFFRGCAIAGPSAGAGLPGAALAGLATLALRGRRRARRPT